MEKMEARGGQSWPYPDVRGGAGEERLNRAGLTQMSRVEKTAEGWRRRRRGGQGRPVPDVQGMVVSMRGGDVRGGQRPS